MKKKITEKDFKNYVKISKNIVVSGFRWTGTPQLLLRLTKESFEETGFPNKITIVFTSSATDPGLDHLANPDLLNCSFGSYYGSIPKIRALAQKNKIKAYSLPQGQISLLFREIARRSPGLISSIGLNTYVDPLFGGGKINRITKDDVVKRIKIEGIDYLFYKSINIDTAFVRGTQADKNGNISMENEPIKTEFLSMAQAVRTCGGKVFVQVCSAIDTVFKANEIDLPNHLVDGYVVTNDVGRDHRHTNKYVKNNNLLNSIIENVDIKEKNDPDYKLIIAKKALNLINKNSNAIIGQGIPELVGVISRKEGKYFKNLTTFMESGVIGGIPERKPDFGVAFGPSAFLTQDNQFVGFNGGHMDLAVLSFVEFDKLGNINVSYLGEDYFGCGGFIDICHAVKTIIFVGSFTAKNLIVEEKDDKVKIINEGTIKKAVNKVKEITFSPIFHNKMNYDIFIVTERCIFKVVNQKVIIIEIFKGIDLQKDILDQMDFSPDINKECFNHND